jgi:hypothetical protein
MNGGAARAESSSTCSRAISTCSCSRGGEKNTFLCGHDEKHWFVAAVPEAARGVNGVATAKAAPRPGAGLRCAPSGARR